ncbi:hypothetical protein [Iningainema tapete]|uniref:Uncharacterized protein n=1 Tax=Iningainema tapete BLCC-T55 TaxID=2748662 RepID=A0A8J6XED6_9CYAN|nr:hypothetical protein [Iningainema tapete]MBD2770831.1 hypothetical protein [Iningainema tapete BLCC-T55]
MTEKITPPNLQEAESLLADLFEEVKVKEGTLAGGERLGIGATAVQSLKETKVSFGNPRDKLILLKEETFKEIGIELTSSYRQQMRNADFYYMTVPVDLRPKPGVQFWRLYCQLDFSPKGEQEPIVRTIFPQSKWETLMKWGIGMDLGLNENLDWSVGVDATKIAEIVNLPGNLKANIASKNEFKAFIVIPDYAYEVGCFEITAQGEGNSTCYWRIEEPVIQKMVTVKFAIVFQVPKGCQSINLEGTAWAEANMDWLFADIRDVFSELADRFKNLLKSKNEAASQFALGDKEKWTLTLPK